MAIELSYDIKLKSNESKLTKHADICKDCVKEKGILQILANRDWQVWNKAGFKWEDPPKE